MNEKTLEEYEKVFGIKKERVQELINELAKDIIERTLRDETDDEYLTESIYQIGKTEDERLFLAYFIGGIRQTVFATSLMSKLEDVLIERDMRFRGITEAFWNDMSNNLGEPDFEQIEKKDRHIFEKAFLASKKIKELIRKKEGGKNGKN